jgi:hypothetical protein
MDNSLAFGHAFKVMGATQQLMVRSLVNLIEMISTSSHRYTEGNSTFTNEALLLMQKASAARDPDSVRALQKEWADTCMKFSQSQTRMTMGFVEQFGQQVLGTIASNPFTPVEEAAAPTPAPSVVTPPPVKAAAPTPKPAPIKASVKAPLKTPKAVAKKASVATPKVTAKPKAVPKVAPAKPVVTAKVTPLKTAAPKVAKPAPVKAPPKPKVLAKPKAPKVVPEVLPKTLAVAAAKAPPKKPPLKTVAKPAAKKTTTPKAPKPASTASKNNSTVAEKP